MSLIPVAAARSETLIGRRPDAGQEREPGGIGEHGELPGPGLDLLGAVGEAMAWQTLGVDDPVVGAVLGQ